LLTLEGIDAYYGDLQALYGVSLEVEQGRVFELVGANAAGKSTTLRVISGLVSPRRGRVVFDGRDLTHVPAHQRVDLGIVQVPEGRRLFPFMSVAENLLLGAHSPRARGARDEMCAIGRALMSRPRVLMLDEPTLGLAPVLVARIFETVRTINGDGMTILLVEQNVRQALTLAHRAAVLESGHLVLTGQGPELLGDDRLKRAYLGL